MFLIIRRAETLPQMSALTIAKIFCATFQVNPKDLIGEEMTKDSQEHKDRLKVLLGTTFTLQY